MKSYLLIFLFATITLISCTKDTTNFSDIEGNYIGTFKRDNNSSTVELQLINNEFYGSSTEGYNKFPAICNGTFTIKGTQISFINSCIWTAEFDWSLILSGNWNYTFKNNTLTLKNSLGDVYHLNKQD